MNEMNVPQRLFPSMTPHFSSAALFVLPIIVLCSIALFDLSFAQGVCRHQGKAYRNGDEWIVSRSFIMTCIVHYNRWETKLIACLSMLGERIPVHGQITDRHGVWNCVQDPNGSTRLVKQQK